MNTKKFLAVITVMAMLVVALIPAAFADDSASAGSALVVEQYGSGASGVTYTPSTVSFSTITVNFDGGDQTSTRTAAATTELEAYDYRSADSTGFTLQITGSTLTGTSSSETIAPANMVMGLQESFTETGDSGTEASPSESFATAAAFNGSAQNLLVITGSDYSPVKYQTGLDFSLTVADTVLNDTYTGTLSFTYTNT
jgi:hypothetical protein